MSDLQDIIASSSIHAFNSGLKTGRLQERQTILEILRTQRDNWKKPATFNYLKALDQLISEIEKAS